jgi:GTP-binding protein
MLAKKLKNNLPTVVIFGRTNVGKSTLFNRLVEKPQALTSAISGTTRDANIGAVSWNRRDFTLVDTGGFLDFKWLTGAKKTAISIDEQVQKQAREFLTRADVVLFVVDAKEGLLPQDKEMSSILKKIMPETKKVILVANKIDSNKEIMSADVFWKLGWGEPVAISAVTGSSTGDLLDLLVKKFKTASGKTAPTAGLSSEVLTKGEAYDERDFIKVCLLGKPNVGKSSLLNAILGYERVIVSPIAHTTREPQDTDLIYKDKPIKIIDTAGISRKWKDAGSLEKMGITKSLEIVDQCDIVLLVVDIEEDLTKQDAKLVEQILERRKSLIIVANKWDLVEGRDTKAYTQTVYRTIPFAQYAPIMFLSAKHKTKINKLMDLILNIADNRLLELKDKELERFIKNCINHHRPTRGKGVRYPRIYYFTQTGTNPPEFMVRVGAQENLAESYLGFIVNQLRARYNLIGTPVKIWVKK